MHAEVGSRYMPLFNGKFDIGKVYDISGFSVSNAGDKYLTVHKSLKIMFNSLTTFMEVENGTNDIPMYKFSFADYPTITKRTNTYKFLTDVIGILHGVGDVVNQSIGNNSVAPKQELILYLPCGTRITATMWGSKTTLLNRSTMDENNTSIILTSMTVKTYLGKQTLGSTTSTQVYTNLEINETTELLKSFRKRKLPAVIEHEIQPQKKDDLIIGKCISEILNEDHPNGAQDCTFAFEAKITDVILTNGWEYLSCNICKTRVGIYGPNNYCRKCESETEFPLHRFRLDLIINDSKTSTSIMLFDKVAEYLLKQKAETLFVIQESEVEGAKKVENILRQVIGNTELFHAKIDKLTGSNGQKKLIACKIATHKNDIAETTNTPETSKNQCSSSTKGTHTKGSARKKNRTSAD